MAVMTMGTQVYVTVPVLDSNEDPTDVMEVIPIECVTSVSPGSSAAEQVDVTCLESKVRQFLSGLETPGTGSLGLNPDPTKDSHFRLYKATKPINGARPILQFAIGWADGTVAPTLDSNDDMVFPTTRSWIYFDGYVSDFPMEFALNAAVSSTVSIQRTGDRAGWIRKAA